MNKTALALCLSLLTSPLAANAQVIDGTSDEAFEQSIKEMQDKLPEEEREPFKNAFIKMILDRYPPAANTENDPFARIAFLPQAIEAAPRTMNGVTYEEIRAEMTTTASPKAETAAGEGHLAAEERRAEAERAEEEAERRRAEALAAALEEGRSDSMEGSDPLASALSGSMPGNKDDAEVRSASELACLQERVTFSNVRIETQEYGGHRARADISSDLPWAIAGLIMKIVATSPGRSVPWGKDEFALPVAGGIEPGETREVSFSVTLSADTPENVEGTVTILDVADPQERLLIGRTRVMNWSEDPSPLSCLDGAKAN